MKKLLFTILILLVSVNCYGANDFTGDASFKALYRFESGALTTDTLGGNTLTDNNTVGTDTVNFQEGSASADFERDNSEYFNITDANLDSGFPLKSGESNKVISVGCWFRPETDISTEYIWAKYTTTGDLRSIAMIYDSDNNVHVNIGYNSGVSFEILVDIITDDLVNGQWYHIMFHFTDSTKAWTLRIYSLTDDSVLFDDSGTSTNNIAITSSEFTIGARGTGAAGTHTDGNIDEIWVRDTITTDAEHDKIIAGTFGAVTTFIPTITIY